MNWEAIAAVAELLGVLAVFVTLIYLAVQIRQNTAAVATATYESTMSGFNDINVVVASNPALAALLDLGCQNLDSLNVEETVQFNFLLRCYANQWCDLGLWFWSSGAGRLDEDYAFRHSIKHGRQPCWRRLIQTSGPRA